MLVLGLGSNLGDRESHLKRTVVRLAQAPGALLANARLSRVYESPALVPDGAPDTWRLPYLNCALAGETTLDPFEVLRHVKEIERSFGRNEARKWAPRPIDIDILWWRDLNLSSAELTIPHPELLVRPFSLGPLHDLVPRERLGGVAVSDHWARATSGRAASASPSPSAGLRVAYPDLMGILNVTPDSFSDGGLFSDPDAAIARAHQMIEDGARILDIGGESTRPDGAKVDAATEWERVQPVLRGLVDLRRGGRCKISLDSRYPVNVRSALEIGIDVVNDVTGYSDPSMLDAVRGSEVVLVCLHSLSVPVVKGEFLDRSLDPLPALVAWTEERLVTLGAAGIDRTRLLIDPGIGFGKTVDQNWQILERIAELHAPGAPLVVGHSRKSFLDAVTDKAYGERDAETLVVSGGLARSGVEILRVHDVCAHVEHFRRQLQAQGAEPLRIAGPGERPLRGLPGY